MMELTIRDWMVIVGVLLILAVLLDAWRRVRSDRYSRVKMKLVDPQETVAERDEDLGWLKELPNGGARVVRHAGQRFRRTVCQCDASRQGTGTRWRNHPHRGAHPMQSLLARHRRSAARSPA